MTAADQIRQQMKSWTPQEIEAFAAKLLIMARPQFHGNIQIHYANGVSKKLVVSETRDL